MNDDDGNLWSKILAEVQSRSSGTLPQASLIVLGDPDCGKTALVSKLQRREDPRQLGAGLEYHYIEVTPDIKDGTYAYQLSTAGEAGESGRLGVWVMDGEAGYSGLARFALPATLVPSSLALVCVSMDEPWALLDSLHRWTAFLDHYLSTLDQRLLTQCREAQVSHWQEYVEPLDSSSHSDLGAKVPSMETEQILLPLSETTLTHNLGLPLIVVVTKCDSMSSLEKEYDFKDEHFDFIQQHIRKFCLNYGAALFYTSAKEGRNCDGLYKYIVHRLYQFPFTQPASVVEKDSIFIPAGWDNEKKIGILHENLRTFRHDDLFSEHVKKPVLRRPQPKETEVSAEDDQSFLTKMTGLLAQQTTASPGPQKGQASVDSPSMPRPMKTAVSVSAATPPKMDPKAGVSPAGVPGGANEGVLASFFNNLLKKNGEGDTPPNNNPAMRNSPSLNGEQLSESQKAAELSRMIDAQKKKDAERGAAS